LLLIVVSRSAQVVTETAFCVHGYEETERSPARIGCFHDPKRFLAQGEDRKWPAGFLKPVRGNFFERLFHERRE
jgi:hypothetical protein